jgi:hypothetical protein
MPIKPVTAECERLSRRKRTAIQSLVRPHGPSDRPAGRTVGATRPWFSDSASSYAGIMLRFVGSSEGRVVSVALSRSGGCVRVAMGERGREVRLFSRKYPRLEGGYERAASGKKETRPGHAPAFSIHRRV